MKYKLLFSLLCTVPTMLFAQEFQSTGIGDTPEQAKKDAIINAIKLSVGELIVSKEQLNNDDFTQNIVGYSNAYVKKIDVNSQKKLDDGSYESNVTVDIESQKLLSTLEGMKVAVLSGTVDNEALLQAINQQDKHQVNKETAQNFDDMVMELLVKPVQQGEPLATISINEKLKAIKPEELRVLYENKKIQSIPNRVQVSQLETSKYYPFELNFSIVKNKKYNERIIKLLNEVKSSNNPDVIKSFNLSKIDDSQPVFRTYGISQQNKNKLSDIISKEIVNSELGREYQCVKIELLDKDGYTISVGKQEITISGYCTQGDSLNTEYMSSILINHSGQLFRYANTSLRDLIVPDFSQGYFTEGAIDLKLYFLLSVDEVKSLREVKLSFSN